MASRRGAGRDYGKAIGTLFLEPLGELVVQKHAHSMKYVLAVIMAIAVVPVVIFPLSPELSLLQTSDRYYRYNNPNEQTELSARHWMAVGSNSYINFKAWPQEWIKPDKDIRSRLV